MHEGHQQGPQGRENFAQTQPVEGMPPPDIRADCYVQIANARANYRCARVCATHLSNKRSATIRVEPSKPIHVAGPKTTIQFPVFGMKFISP